MKHHPSLSAELLARHTLISIGALLLTVPWFLQRVSPFPLSALFIVHLLSLFRIQEKYPVRLIPDALLSAVLVFLTMILSLRLFSLPPAGDHAFGWFVSLLVLSHVAVVCFLSVYRLSRYVTR